MTLIKLGAKISICAHKCMEKNALKNSTSRKIVRYNTIKIVPTCNLKKYRLNSSIANSPINSDYILDNDNSALLLLFTLKTLYLFFETFRRRFHKSFVHNFVHLLHKLWKIVFSQTRGRNRRQNCNITSS